MAKTDFTINGKINVDSREYQAFLKSRKELEKFQIQSEINRKKAQEEQISALEKEIKLLKEKEKTEKKNLSSTIQKKQAKLDELKTQQKINKAQQDYNKAKDDLNKKIERESKLQQFKEQSQERLFQREINKLSAGPRDTARLAGQIGSWAKGGVFEFLADQEQIRGDKKLDEIFQKGEIKKGKIQEQLAAGQLTEEEAGEAMKIIEQDTQRESAIVQGQTKGNVGKYQAMAVAAQKVAGQLSAIGKKIGSILLSPFKKLEDAIMATVKAMLDFKTGVVTFGTSTSLITNAAAREQQLKYGLTPEMNYGFTKAKELLNIQSDEDLMYMNKDQRDRLLSYMEQYSTWYSEMEASGVLQSIQEMQLEFAELKEEIAMELLQWIAENKDTIMTCIRGIFDFIKIIANSIMSIIRLFGGDTKNYDLYNSADASDTVNNNNNSKHTQINMNINNTSNATGVLGSKEALDQFNDQTWADLAKQVVGAIGG